MHSEPQRGAQLPQQRHVARPLVTEGEICAHAKTLDPAETLREVPDKTFPGLFAERLVEMDQEQRLRTHGLDDAHFLSQRINQRRDAMGRHDGVGMPVERDDKTDRFLLPGVGDGLPDDLLVPEMNAVEEADRQADLAAPGIQFRRGVNDIHP